MSRRDFDPVHFDMRRHVTTGLLSSGFVQIIRVLCQVASVVVLSRLLPPSEFGVVAMAGPVIGFVTLFQDLGLSQATVQKQELSHEEVNAFFWINVGGGAGLSLLVVAISPFAGAYYDEPRVVPLTMALGSLILLGSVGGQSGAIVTRRMQYHLAAINGAVSIIVGLVVSVAVALLLKNYWALFWGQFASTLAGVTGIWIAARWRPSLPQRVAGLSHSLKFGAGITGANVAGFISRNCDNILIGWKWGETSLGLYDRAYKLLLFPIERLAAPLMVTMLPVLCRLLPEPERYRKVYLRALSLLLLASWPGICWAIAFGRELVLVVLGQQWHEAGTIFAPLAVTALVQMVNNGAGYLYTSQRRGTELARWAVIGAACDLISFVIGLPFGPVGVARAYMVSEYLRTPLLWYLVTRSGPVGWRHVGFTIAPHAVAAAVTLATLYGLKEVLRANGPIALVIGLIVAHASFIGGMALSQNGRTALCTGVEEMRRFLSRKSKEQVI